MAQLVKAFIAKLDDRIPHCRMRELARKVPSDLHTCASTYTLKK